MKGKMFKKTAAFILALALVSGVMPQTTGEIRLYEPCVTADAADSTAILDRETGTLILSGNINKEDVQAYAGNTAVKKVFAASGAVLPEDCSELFMKFNASEIYLNEADFSKVRTSAMNMFGDCKKLKTLNLGDFDTTRLLYMTGMFSGCTSLVKLDLTSFDTSNTGHMDGMFYNCTSLKTITVSDKWNTGNLRDSSEMFKNCVSLVGGNGTVYDSEKIKYEYARIDTEETPGYLSKPNVTYYDFKINGKRYNSESSYAQFSYDADTTTLTVNYEYFGYVSDDKTVNIPIDNQLDGLVITNTRACVINSYDSKQVVLNSDADLTIKAKYDISLPAGVRFNKGAKLTLDDCEITAPAGAHFVEGVGICVEGSDTELAVNVVISPLHRHAWGKWSILKEPTAEEKGLMKRVCEECGEEETFEIPRVTSCKLTGGTLTLLAGEVLKEDVDAYAENSVVTKVVAEKGAILPADCSTLFKDFRAYEIDLTNADSSNVKTSTMNMFNGCKNLKTLKMGDFDTSKLLNTSGMFAYCESLTALDLTSFDTSNVNYMDGMFYNCTSLKTITVSDKWTTSNVNRSSNMFTKCTSIVGGNGTVFDSSKTNASYARIDKEGEKGYLTEVMSNDLCTLKGSILTLKGKVKLSDVRVFAKNDTVETIVAEEGTVLPSICDEMFKDFTDVKNIDLKNADSSNVSSMVSMFENCVAVSTVDLRSFDTKNVTDLTRAFALCTQLSKLIVGEKWNISASAVTKDACLDDFKLKGRNGSTYDDVLIRKEMPLQPDAPDHMGLCTYKGAPIIHFYRFDGTGMVDVPDGKGESTQVSISSYTSDPNMPDIKLKAGTYKYVLPECKMTYPNEYYRFSNYSVNGKEYLPGDEITLTEEYTCISVNYGFTPVTSVMYDISILPDLEGYDSWKEHFDGIAEKYCKLTDEQKALVTNYDTYIETAKKYYEKHPEEITANYVVSVIDFYIGTVELTDECKAKIDYARAVYEKLVDTKKSAVTNYEKLEKAEKEYAALEVAAIGDEDVISVISQIDSIHKELWSDNPDLEAVGKAIEAAEKAYAAIDEKYQSNVTNYKDLLNDKKYHTALKTAAEMTEKAENAEKEAASAKAAQEKAETAQKTAEDALAAANTELADAKNSLSEAETALENAEKDLKAANDKVSDLEKQLKDAQEKIKLLEDSADADEVLKKQAEELTEQLEAAKAAQEKAEAEAETQKATAEKEAAAQAKAEKNAETAVAAQKTAETAQAAAEAAQAKAEEEADAAKTAQEKAEKELASAQTALESAKSDLKTANANVADLTEKLEAAEAKIKALEGEASADEVLQKEAAELKEKLEAAKAAQAAAEKTAEEAAAAQKTAEEAAAVAKKAQTKAEEESESAKTAQEKAEKNLETAQASLKTVNAELETAKFALETANTDLETANAKVEELNAKIKELTEAVDGDESLKKQISELNEELNEAEKAKKAAETDKAAAETQAKNYKALADEASAALKAAQNELAELKETLSKTEYTIGDIDGDGTVDARDAAILTRYVNGVKGIEVNIDTANLDRDGVVDIQDAMILTRYVNGWEGYDSYIITTEKQGGTDTV
ncbi:MAG: BspA family leucine-rich repeat surface protein [Ruminococcus sp.]|nr:BspA family leucine-rich repeat surface protein [Ruminococcus sp.]